MAVKLSVTVFASLARAVSALLLAMATVVRLGSVLSTVTLLLSVVAVTALAVLPTRSVTEIENTATPSAEPAQTEAVATEKEVEAQAREMKELEAQTEATEKGEAEANSEESGTEEREPRAKRPRPV